MRRYKKDYLPHIDFIPGIYSIKCNEYIYVGRSLCVRERILHHIARLKRGKHANHILQSCFNKYGKESFEFSVLEETKEDIEYQILRESYWINKISTCNFSSPCDGSNAGKDNARYDHNLFEFYHPKIGIFSGTKYEFSRLFNLDRSSVTKLTKGKNKTCQGWRMNYPVDR